LRQKAGVLRLLTIVFSMRGAVGEEPHDGDIKNPRSRRRRPRPYERQGIAAALDHVRAPGPSCPFQSMQPPGTSKRNRIGDKAFTHYGHGQVRGTSMTWDRTVFLLHQIFQLCDRLVYCCTTSKMLPSFPRFTHTQFAGDWMLRACFVSPVVREVVPSGGPADQTKCINISRQFPFAHENTRALTRQRNFQIRAVFFRRPRSSSSRSSIAFRTFGVTIIHGLGESRSHSFLQWLFGIRPWSSKSSRNAAVGFRQIHPATPNRRWRSCRSFITGALMAMRAATLKPGIAFKAL